MANFINEAANADPMSLDEETWREMKRDSAILREYLFDKTPPGFVATPQAVSGRLRDHRDEPVQYDGKTLILRGNQDRNGVMEYFVATGG